MNKRISVDIALILVLLVWIPILGVDSESSNIVHFELQPNPNVGTSIDGVRYSFWTAVVTSSSYGTGNIVVIFKRITGNTHTISVYVTAEDLILGEKYGWLMSLVYPTCVPAQNYIFEGVHQASITIEETTIDLTATVSGPISLSITYTPSQGSTTYIEDPDDRPYLHDYDEDGFWSYETQTSCSASGNFNGYQFGPTSGEYDLVDYEWYNLGTLKPPEKKDIEVEITKPEKGKIFHITPTPAMPIIDCSVKINGIDPDPTDVIECIWEAQLSHTWNDRYAIGGSRSQSFTFNDKTIGGSWTPNFGGIIMGGSLDINVKVVIGGTEFVRSVSVEIRGKNPSKETVKAELGELKYQVLTYCESKPKWHQFDKELPVFGKPSGYGLMQLDPPPSYREIWDWKANIEAGKEHFNKDIEQAEGYASYVREHYNGEEPVTDLSEEQILQLSYYMYNAGRAYIRKEDGRWHPYYVWNVEADMWIENKHARSTGKNHADKAMGYLNDILLGELPEAW